MDEIRFPHLEQVLNDFARDAKENYKSALRSSDHVASGALSTFEARVVHEGTVYRVTFELEKYWRYVEEGTKAHWPPREAILDWINVKPVVPRPDEYGRIPSPKSLAFLICRSIAGKSPNQEYLRNPQGGTIGTHDLERSSEQTRAWYEERIQKALEEDLQEILRFYYTEIAIRQI